MIGAVAGILLTVPFALAFDEAYDAGGAGLLPARFSDWLSDHGLLGGDAVVVYDRYGVAYLLALVVLTASLVALARPVRGPVRVVTGGLVILCIGVLGDYAIPNDVVGGVGFLLEGVGYLVVALGIGLLARERAARGRLVAFVVALGVLGCMLAGVVLTGHIPSGPGLPILVAAALTAIRWPQLLES